MKYIIWVLLLLIPLSICYADHHMPAFANSGKQMSVKCHEKCDGKLKTWLVAFIKRNTRFKGTHILDPFFKDKYVDVLNASASVHPTENTKIRFKIGTDDIGISFHGEWKF